MRRIQLDPTKAAPDRTVRTLRFGPDGQTLGAVLGRADNPARRLLRYDFATTGRLVLPPDPGTSVYRAYPDPLFGPDLRFAADVVSGPDFGGCLLRLADTRDEPARVWRLAVGDHRYATAAGFAADGGTLFAGLVSYGSAFEPGALQLACVDLAGCSDPAGPAVRTLLLPAGDASRWAVLHPASLAAGPGGRLAVGTVGGTAILSDPAGAVITVVHRPGATSPPAVRQVLWSPDGGRLVTRGAGELAVWDALTGRELARVRGPKPLVDAAFAPDGTLLAAARDQAVHRFDADRYAPTCRFAPGVGPLHSVAVSADGLTVAAGGSNGVVALWDL